MRGIKITTVSQPLRISATTNGAAVDLLPYDGVAKLHMKSSGTEGAGQTLDVKIQHSADGSTGWADATMPITGAAMAFTQVINAASAGQSLEINIADLKRYIRAVQTLAGSSPFATCYVSLVAKTRTA